MDGLYITAVSELSIPDPLGKGFRIREKYFLTNDSSIVAGLLTPQMQSIIGRIESHYLLNTSAAFYSKPPFEGAYRTHEQALAALNTHLRITQAFLYALWFVKDHAINFELGFLKHPQQGPNQEVSVTSNALAVRVSNFEGEHPATSFSLNELRAARKVFDELVPAEVQVFTKLPVDSVRFERATHFVSAARAASTMGIKVANYVTALEALFATDTQELSHKLSERVALFLGESLDERKEIFTAVKAAYRLRSRVLHGDRLTRKDAASISAIAKGVDAIARRALAKLLGSPSLYELFEDSSEVIDEYFLDAVLEANAP
ncbi:MAG: hypothetical protein AMXMBFR36_30790 [Acidobacteriota bacterium]